MQSPVIEMMELQTLNMLGNWKDNPSMHIFISWMEFNAHTELPKPNEMKLNYVNVNIWYGMVNVKP